MPSATNKTSIRDGLNGGLIASCQPVANGAMDTDDMVIAMAQACEDGGATAVRIEGVTRVRKVAKAIKIPVVGIVKRDLSDSPVRITPYTTDVIELAVAGAQIIAVDATARRRPSAVAELLATIHQQGCLAMADCATHNDGVLAHAMGFDLVGTTLSGYTAETACPDDAPFDAALIQSLTHAGCWVVAEGRIRNAAEAASALQLGAKAVTVGSALTRLELMVAGYVRALKAAQ